MAAGASPGTVCVAFVGPAEFALFAVALEGVLVRKPRYPARAPMIPKPPQPKIRRRVQELGSDSDREFMGDGAKNRCAGWLSGGFRHFNKFFTIL